MDSLIQLVKSYTDGGVTYQAFRRELVMHFLSGRIEDSFLERAVLGIECLCADLSVGEISTEKEFRTRLQFFMGEVSPIIPNAFE